MSISQMPFRYIYWIMFLQVYAISFQQSLFQKIFAFFILIFTTIIYITMTQVSDSSQQSIKCQQASQFLSGFSLFSQCCAAQNSTAQQKRGKKVQNNRSGLVKNKSFNSLGLKSKQPKFAYKKTNSQLLKQNNHQKLSIKQNKTRETNVKQIKSMKSLLLSEFEHKKRMKRAQIQNDKQQNKNFIQPSIIDKTPSQSELVQRTFVKSTQKPYVSSSYLQPVRVYDQFKNNNSAFSKQSKLMYPTLNHCRTPQLDRFPQRGIYQVSSPFYRPIQSQPLSPRMSPMKIPQLQKNYLVQCSKQDSKNKRQTHHKKKIDDNQSSQKTQKKQGIQQENISLYRDLKNISIANSAQLQNSDKLALNDFIKQKLKQSDLQQTKKQSRNLNQQKSSHQKQSMQKNLRTQFPLIQSQQISMKKAKKKEQEFSKGQDNQQANFKKISKPISPFFPQTAIAKSKISHRIMNPQFYEKQKYIKEPMGYGISSHYSNLNHTGRPISRNNMTGLSSLTVNSYMQSIQQSKIVQKVQQSMVFIDFFHPKPGRKLTDTNYENFESRQL